MELESVTGGNPVVLLHGWPGLPSDYRALTPLLPGARVLIPTLAGFGTGYTGPIDTDDATADSYARRLLSELDAEGVTSGVTIVGYDIGSRIAQSALRADPDRFTGAVLTPGYPGIGERAGAAEYAERFWYQHFHRTPLAAQLIDGNESNVASYLDWVWDQWSGPGAPQWHPHRDDLIAAYSRPGAFHASIQWYTANRGYSGALPPIHTPTTILWPDADPLFPPAWADRIPEFFSTAVTHSVAGCGHFLPLENPAALADAILRHAIA